MVQRAQAEREVFWASRQHCFATGTPDSQGIWPEVLENAKAVTCCCFFCGYLILSYMLRKKKKNPLSFVALSKLSLFHLLSWVFKGQWFHLTFIFQFSWNLDNCSGVHKLGSACPRLPVDRERGKERGNSYLIRAACHSPSLSLRESWVTTLVIHIRHLGKILYNS